MKYVKIQVISVINLRLLYSELKKISTVLYSSYAFLLYISFNFYY